MKHYSRDDIELLMLPQMDAIVDYWNEHAQIFEGQFQFASEHILDKYTDTVFDIMTAHGAYVFHRSDDDEDSSFNHIVALAFAVPGRGHMHSMCSLAVMDIAEMKQNVLAYYQSQQNS